MTSRFAGRTTAAVALAWSLAAAIAGAQSGKTWTPGRTPDGQPNFQGVWTQQGLTIPTYSLEDGPTVEHSTAIGQARQPNRPSAIVDPSDGRILYQPWAAVQQKAVFDFCVQEFFEFVCIFSQRRRIELEDNKDRLSTGTYPQFALFCSKC